MKYRADIDGLRAIAVIPVVLYHYRIAPFGGGYVGVDVFFVISGFLITSLIYGEIADDRFSIETFYERRIRRIFPALFFVLAIVTVFSFVLFLPGDLLRYGKSLLATTFFVSNFEFWGESGYFDAGAELKPLLHTWSLAIEEQFYLIFPLLLYLLRNESRNRVQLIVGVLAAASFAFSVWAVQLHPALAFYLAPARVWELFLGSMLALSGFAPPKSSILTNFVATSGLILIVCSVFLFTRETPFPGLAATCPCIGTLCLIYSGASESLSLNKLLGTRPVVAVGLFSYSLYLWHWPIFVFANYYAVGGLTLPEKAALIALAFGLASFSFHFVESPFRGKRAIVERETLLRLGGIAVVTTVAAGLTAYVLHGIPERFPLEVRNVLVAASSPPETKACPANEPLDIVPAHPCFVGSSRQAVPTFLLWGDSLAHALEPAFQLIAEKQNRLGLTAEHNGCAALVGVERSDTIGCAKFNNAALKVALEGNIRDVILVSRWALNSEGTMYGAEVGRRVTLTSDEVPGPNSDNNHQVFFHALEQTIRALRAAGKRVIFVNSTPEIGRLVPDTLAKLRLLHSNLDIEPPLKDYQLRQAFVLASAERLRRSYAITIVNPSDVLCATGKCIVEIEGKPIYRDSTHLNRFGTSLLMPLLEKIL